VRERHGGDAHGLKLHLFVFRKWKQLDDVQITVLDADGGKVMEKTLKMGAEGLLTRIDLTDQASGIYFISVQQNDKGKVSKVVKQ